MKNSELKNKTEKELEKDLAKAREEVRKFRFAMSGSNTRSVKEARQNKKIIAQILTEMNNRAK